LFGNAFRRIAALPLMAKIVIALVALVVSIVASPVIAYGAALVFVVAVVALLLRAPRHRPLRSWGIVAIASLLLVVIFGSVSNALYPGLQTPGLQTISTQASAPSEPKQEAKPTSLEPKEEAEQEQTPVEKGEEKAGIEEGPRPEYDATVRVTRVVDGDTIEIDPVIDGIEDVRLIGVDAPETNEPGCAPQPSGANATRFTSAELEGEEVQLEFGADREDQYGRLLAYVHELDGGMFNEDLLEEGYAQVYIVSPNDEHEDSFEEAQAEAQAAGRGIWGLSPEQLALLTDRGNGIGGDGCTPRATTPPKT
jgi:micrococcal nuclease